MFSALDILNVVIISVLVVTLLMMLKVDTILERHRMYLQALITVVIFILINDELAYLGFTRISAFLTPINYLALFLIYPILYLYLSDMVFNDSGSTDPVPYRYLIFPVIICALLSVYFFLLPAEMYEMMIIKHLSNDSGENSYLTALRFFLISGYYLQTVFFLWKIYNIKRVYHESYGTDANELKIIRLSVLFVPVIIFYEVIIIVSAAFVNLSDYEIKVFELIMSLMFVLFALYVIFNHSVLLVQLRLEKFHARTNNEFSAEHSNLYSAPSKSETKEIKELLENFLRASKVYLDPNLSIEILARKIHIQSRKISYVINHVYHKNFHAFINEFRVSEAIILLKAGKNNNLEELYVKVGFNSRSTFNRVFKSVTGFSPSDYLASL